MENRSFEGDSDQSGQDPKANPGSSEPRVGPSGDGQDPPKDGIPPLARITEDEGESPPAYQKRYEELEKKRKLWKKPIDLDLEYPQEPVWQPDVRSDPVLQRQASKRRERRSLQHAVEGPCSLRQDSPTSPLPPPEPYPESEQQPSSAPEQPLADSSPPDQQAILTPPPPQTWRERFSLFYERVTSIAFQYPLHICLLVWPLSTGVLGLMNIDACPMTDYLPYMMIAVGLLGTAVILLRLFILFYTEGDQNATYSGLLWRILRVAELIVWIFFSTQLYYFFEQNPSFTPGDDHYCMPRFYKITCGVMYLSAATMVGWIVVNLINLFYKLYGRLEVM